MLSGDSRLEQRRGAEQHRKNPERAGSAHEAESSAERRDSSERQEGGNVRVFPRKPAGAASEQRSPHEQDYSWAHDDSSNLWRGIRNGVLLGGALWILAYLAACVVRVLFFS